MVIGASNVKFECASFGIILINFNLIGIVCLIIYALKCELWLSLIVWLIGHVATFLSKCLVRTYPDSGSLQKSLLPFLLVLTKRKWMMVNYDKLWSTTHAIDNKAYDLVSKKNSILKSLYVMFVKFLYRCECKLYREPFLLWSLRVGNWLNRPYLKCDVNMTNCVCIK